MGTISMVLSPILTVSAVWSEIPNGNLNFHHAALSVTVRKWCRGNQYPITYAHFRALLVQ